MTRSPTRFVTGGGMRIDYLITHDGTAYTGLVGGNALYAAVGAALWQDGVGLWSRLGENYPTAWPATLQEQGLDVAGLRRVKGRQEHRTFYAYTADGQRDDTNPAAHFARINHPLPAALNDYTHSTPGQDEPERYDPLALRPEDWPAAYAGAAAVHLAPIAIRTHCLVPPHLRQTGVQLVTADPGERYMVPALMEHIRRLVSRVDAFLPSLQEIRSLFGPQIRPAEAARTLAGWGARWVVIKVGKHGVFLYEKGAAKGRQLPPFHTPGDRRIIDVTGAGDAFCGGFLVGLAQSGDPLQAAQRGLISASLVVEGYGALYALGRGREEARQRLAEYKSA